MHEQSKKSTISKQAKIEALLTDLSTSNVSKVKTALEGLKIIGEPNVLCRVIKQLDPSKPSEKNSLILEFLSCLKDSKARGTMMEIVQDSEYISYQQLVLSTIWNSPLDYTDYLEVFVEIAIQSDFMTTLECLTIIENLEGPFSEDSVMEAQVLLGAYVDTNPDKNTQKGVLMSEIALLIQHMQRMLDIEE